jgi:hypothetical protein
MLTMIQGYTITQCENVSKTLTSCSCRFRQSTKAISPGLAACFCFSSSTVNSGTCKQVFTPRTQCVPSLLSCTDSKQTHCTRTVPTFRLTRRLRAACDHQTVHCGFSKEYKKSQYVCRMGYLAMVTAIRVHLRETHHRTSMHKPRSQTVFTPWLDRSFVNAEAGSSTLHT